MPAPTIRGSGALRAAEMTGRALGTADFVWPILSDALDGLSPDARRAGSLSPRPAINRAIYKALKPGGLYVIIDHSAKDGAGIGATETLHRIDAAVVKRDLADAGFVLVSESNLLHNPTDPRDQLSEAPSMIDKTDQFFYVFRKP